ncbi:serine/threonine-protein kinase Nek1-like 2 [Homarus americanus]|uniref:non-specific serine/threonine protein kinase n=1 Tax=Homarus americanus TaxID=6706 RepID=A0A8J5JUP4_HOMAM|nr:serine/threonine-protein kinase Nek1-like 2 [Homarus americanus]
MKALQVLVMMATTYLSEQGFSALVELKTKMLIRDAVRFGEGNWSRETYHRNAGTPPAIDVPDMFENISWNVCSNRCVQQVEMEGIKKVRKLGSGTFGVVYLVEKNNKSYVLKTIDLSKVSSGGHVYQFQEVALLRNLKHESIVAYELFVDDGFSQLFVDDGFSQLFVDDGFTQLFVDDGFSQLFVDDGFSQLFVDDGYSPFFVDDGFSQLLVDDGFSQLFVVDGFSQLFFDDGLSYNF